MRKEDVEVVRVINSSGSEAVVESRLTAAFRMERTDQKWQVREVRLGRGRWEQISTLEKALGQIKIEATEEMLDRIAAAVLAYRKANAHLPQINDYVALSDLLTPGYLTPLIRLDAWNRPFYATVTSAGTVTIRSAGPDGRIDTEDDIQKTL